MRNYWDKFTLKLGNTILHPQFIILSFNKETEKEVQKLAKNKNILDIGSGNSPYRKNLEKIAKKYTGLDHPEISKYYHPETKPEILADISKKLNIKNSTFDMVLLLDVLTYLEKPELSLKEINRILKRKGILMLSSAFLYSLMTPKYDRNRFTLLQLKSLLKRSGFKITKTQTRGNFISFWLLSLIIFLLKRIRDVTKSKKNLISFIYLTILIIIIAPITLTINCIFLLTKKFKSQYYNYFPISYLITAVKE